VEQCNCGWNKKVYYVKKKKNREGLLDYQTPNWNTNFWQTGSKYRWGHMPDQTGEYLNPVSLKWLNYPLFLQFWWNIVLSSWLCLRIESLVCVCVCVCACKSASHTITAINTVLIFWCAFTCCIHNNNWTSFYFILQYNLRVREPWCMGFIPYMMTHFYNFFQLM